MKSQIQKIGLIGMLFVSTSISAQNIPIKTLSEVVGCWERIDFSEDMKKQINEIEPWPSRYQWYCFESDGSMQSLHSSEAKAINSAELQQAFSLLKSRSEFTWKLLPNSYIQTSGKAGKETIFWASAFLGASYNADQKIIEKGTLIMSIYDQSKNRAVYWRYLKRIH